MVQAYNLSTQYVEAGGSEVQSQPGLHGLKSKHMIRLLKPEQECSKPSRKCNETASLGPLVYGVAPVFMTYTHFTLRLFP